VLLDELRKRELQIVSTLSAPTDKSQFEFGRICGMYQEHQVIRSLIERYLDESDRKGRFEES
jgi:hypothetical protein